MSAYGPLMSACPLARAFYTRRHSHLGCELCGSALFLLRLCPPNAMSLAKN